MIPHTIVGLLFLTVVCMAADEKPVYKDEKAPVDARVKDLLGRMALEEKVAQLVSSMNVPGMVGVLGPQGINAEAAKKTLGNGLGTMAFMGDFFGTAGTPRQAAIDRNHVQKWVLENTRLGIPILFHGEALHGAVNKGTTLFPAAIGLGSTWDPDLLVKLFTAAAAESRAIGNALVLAPVLDLGRDPRYGRIEEMYSEDPYLAGRLGVAAVTGLQGPNGSFGLDQVIATAKHFVHGQPESGTNVGPSDYSERTMRDVFLVPFEQAVKVAKIGAVMPSYNENNGGIPSSANPWLLEKVLRDEWGFQGLTVSDYFAVQQLQTLHHLVPDKQAAGVLALSSGMDMELPAPFGFSELASAVKAGKTRESDIDAAVARVLRAKFQIGLFDHPYSDPDKAERIAGSKEHAALARTVADQAIILLKNDGNRLPLNGAQIKTLAVIGPNADKKRLGGYSGTPPYFVTVLDGIRKRVEPATKVVYAEGCRISEPDTSSQTNFLTAYKAPDEAKDKALVEEAVQTAGSADVIVLVLGGNESVSRESLGNTGGLLPTSYGDTDTLELPGRQNELARRILELGKPVVVVLLNGRPYSINELAKRAPAILEGWYLGQETGNAIAGVLFGDINPSGHLPVTIARNVGQLPAFYYRTPAARRGYVLNENTPLYPFGFGLSYTTFSYGKPELDRVHISPGGMTKVSVNVRNTGDRDGADVVQMYIHHRTSSVVQPILALRGFKRVYLKTGESATVEFEVGPAELAILDREMKRTVEPGVVEIRIGNNCVETQAVQLTVTP